MAVDPITAAKVTGTVVEHRETIFKIIVGTVFAVCVAIVLITSIATYLVAAPMSQLTEYFKGPVNYAALTLFRRTYGNILDEDYSGSFDKSYSGEYPFPVPVYRISSEYGWLVHPTLGTMDRHNGLDIITELHAPIKAIDKGVVADIGVNKFFGRYVMVQHERTIIVGYENIPKGHPDYDPDGDNRRPIKEKETFYSFYAHMASISIACNGQEVDKGLVLGTVGGDPKNDPFPGASTGAHLHFGIYHSLDLYNGDVDPHDYVMK